MADTSSPSMRMRPWLGRSRPAMMLRRVVLPEPERPMTATKSPRSTSKETSLRAWMVCPATGKSRLTFSTWTRDWSGIFGRGLLWEDFDVVGGQAELGALVDVQAFEVFLGYLEAAGAVDDGVFVVVDVGFASLKGDAAEALGADAAVANGDDAVDLVGDCRIVGDDDDCDAHLLVEGMEEVEDFGRGLGV